MIRRVACLTLACSTGLAGCSLITFGTDRNARVEVDPVVRQHILIYATGELVENERVQDHDNIVCAAATPRVAW